MSLESVVVTLATWWLFKTNQCPDVPQRASE